MEEVVPGEAMPMEIAAAYIAPAAPHGLRDWFREGLRAAAFRAPRPPAAEPAPWHLLALLVTVIAFQLLVSRLAIPGGAEFSLGGWLASWWTIPPTLLLAWALFTAYRPEGGERASVATWYGLLAVATLPLTVVGGAYEYAWYRKWLPRDMLDSGLSTWAIVVVLWGWYTGVAARVAASLGLARAGRALLAVGIVSLLLANSYQFSQARAWYPTQREDDDAPRRERFILSQETFETQQAVWKQAVDGLLPQRKGVRDVYGIVFAPYASEDVFQRESKLAVQVLGDRFDAQGRVLHLLNHAETSKTLPWATPENLRRAIQAVAAHMDREQDVLVLYLTSHGARNFELAASHWPLDVPAVTPAELRKALDDTGIRNRVIAISACYSGGWVEPLASENTLVMTAADAAHTSYGCGNRSELTFFGRALWDEQLRKTHSFETAFAAAVPVIRQREIEAKKADGFSNPQIRVGEAIKPVLAEVAKRLDRSRPQ